jgi:hypothetical protein
MKDETFDKIWNIICDTAMAIENDTNKRAHFRPVPKDELKGEIKRRYEEFRGLCKERHMLRRNDNTLIDNGDDRRIDRHKVAACFACALLHTSPLNQEKDKEATKLLYYANETLAFLVALSIMKSFTNAVVELRESKNSKNSSYEDGVDMSALSRYDSGLLMRIVEDGYRFPEGPHNDFLLWQLMALSDINNYSEFILSLSCTLFLIEGFSIEYYK